MVQDNHILEKDTSPNLEVARETPKEAKLQDLVSKNPSWPEFEAEKTIREQARESLPSIESSDDVEKISLSKLWPTPRTLVVVPPTQLFLIVSVATANP